MSDRSFDRYVRSISKPLTDLEQRYCMTVLRSSPRHRASAEAMVAHWAEYLMGAISYFHKTLVLCGMEKCDVFSFLYESLQSCVLKFDPDSDLSKFGRAWSASLRNDVIDYLRVHNHLVHLPRKQFTTHKQNGSFVRSQYPSLDMPQVAWHAENALMQKVAPLTAEDAYLCVILRERVRTFIERKKLTPRQRFVLEEHVLSGTSGPDTVALMVEAGLPTCTDSNVSQIKSKLLHMLAEQR